MVYLNGKNWTIWKSRMEDLIHSKDLYLLLKNVEGKLKKMFNEDWASLDRKVVSCIWL